MSTAKHKLPTLSSGQIKAGRNQAGFTIIELMIGIALGFILSGMVVSVYINNKKVYTETLVFSAMQENTRFAMRQISHDLRMAGFFGGADRLAIENSTGVAGMTLTPACHGGGVGFDPFANLDYTEVIAVHHYATTTTLLPACLAAHDVVVGTDILYVRFALPVALADVQSDRTYIVSGLEQAKHYLGSEIIATTDLTIPGGEIPDGEIFEYRHHVYFVSMRHANERPSLRRLRLQGNLWIEEIIAEDIEDIHFVMGVANTEGQVQRYYVNPSEVPNWRNVTAMNFFVRSQIKMNDPTFVDRRIYAYGNRNFNPQTDNLVFINQGGATVSRSFARNRRRLNETTVTIYNNQMTMRQ